MKVLVIGSTGAMGTAVIQSLLTKRHRDINIMAMTRDLSSQQAAALSKFGDGKNVELVQGDLNDEESVRRAMKGVDAVFCNTAFFSTGSVEGEMQQGLVALHAARDAGINHFVYSSLDPATRLSGGRIPVPHYDSKASVEAYIDSQRSEEFMKKEDDGWYSKHVSVLVTCPYMENFYDFFAPEDGTLSDGRSGKIFRGPIVGDGVWQMVSLKDLGYFARLILEDRQKWRGRTLRIASTESTMSKIVHDFEEYTGIPSEYLPMSEEEFLSSGLPNAHDPLNNMLIYREGFFEARDFNTLKDLNSGLQSFQDWLVDTGWKGESRLMRKNAPTGSIAVKSSW